MEKKSSRATQERFASGLVVTGLGTQGDSQAIREFDHPGGMDSAAKAGASRRTPKEDAARARLWLAASAVLADGFVHEGVEFGASKCDFFCRAFAAITRFGKFGAPAGWRGDLIAGASGHELGDFASGKELGLTGKPGSEGDLGEMLDDLHTIKSGEKIGSASDRAVIGKKQRIVMRDVRLEDGAEIRSARGSVADERNLAETDDNFRKECLIETLAGGREAGSRGRMSVANGLDIGAHAVEEEMHARLRRNLAVAVKVTSLEVHDDEIAGSQHALIQASGSGEDAVGIQADRKIPLGGDDMAALVKPATDKTDVVAVLLFAASRRNGQWVRRHGADSFPGRGGSHRNQWANSTAKLVERP